MTQLSLLNAPMRPQAAPKAPEQAKQAARVGRGIDAEVVTAAKVYAGAAPFHLDDFTARVRRGLATLGRGCAPDSPRRRLKALVDAGFIGAGCVDRSRSLWRIDWVKP
jgi:hypothetical protein